MQSALSSSASAACQGSAYTRRQQQHTQRGARLVAHASASAPAASAIKFRPCIDIHKVCMHGCMGGAFPGAAKCRGCRSGSPEHIAGRRQQQVHVQQLLLKDVPVAQGRPGLHVATNNAKQQQDLWLVQAQQRQQQQAAMGAHVVTSAAENIPSSSMPLWHPSLPDAVAWSADAAKAIRAAVHAQSTHRCIDSPLSACTTQSAHFAWLC